jgi:prolyl oligopeptidase
VLIKNIGLFPLGAVLGLAVLALALAGERSRAQERKYVYPPARQDNQVDTFFGTTVRDPYRWLENADSPETQAWVEAENQLFHDFVNSYPGREKIKARLTELWNYPKYSLPQKEGAHYFFWKNDGLQPQAVLYVQPALDAPARVLLDPNTWSPDGTVAASGEFYSHDGSLMAYAVSKSGSDWEQIKIRGVDSGRDYDEVLEHCRFTAAAWKHDNSGFFYTRFPDPGSVPEEDRNNYNKVYYHRLDTPQAQDALIYERPDQKQWGFEPFITDDGKYLVLHVYFGTDTKNRVYYRETDSDAPFIPLLDDFDAAYNFIDNVGPLFYFKTDLDAPRGRVIAIDLNHPERAHWREIVPQKPDVISSAGMIDNQLVLGYLHDAYTKIRLSSLEGKDLGEVPLPTLGSAESFSGKREDKEMFLHFESFLYPPTDFRYDFAARKLIVFRKSEVQFDPARYVTRQVFYPSKDGTKIPMFIMSKKGLKLDGTNPTLLYGYGGYGINETPVFSVGRLTWLEAGGVYAVANIRGGGEYGEEWHRAGMLAKKQNVFDDFIAGAEYLIKEKYTGTPRLAIMGGSNGGLLVSACLTQRPELLGAVIAQVPVTDMLRYQKFTVGRYWVPEYGDAEHSAEEFKYLRAYSPLHNVKPGVTYPPTLVVTADTDDRVAPGHAKKFVATLQAADPGQNPILLRVETKAGHGHGKPTAKIIDEAADLYAFLFKVFGME